MTTSYYEERARESRAIRDALLERIGPRWRGFRAVCVEVKRDHPEWNASAVRAGLWNAIAHQQVEIGWDARVRRRVK